MKNQGISRQEVLERLAIEKRKTGGLISDEALLRMIAVDLGIEVLPNGALEPALCLGDLIPGLSNVSIVGRVVALFAPRAFNRNRSGKIASLLVTDQSGLLRVVLWNGKTSLIESGTVKVGQIVRFSHGYTREDHAGRVELHIGERGEIETKPSGVQAKDYPTINKFLTKIGKLTDEDKRRRVNIMGAVQRVSPVSTFDRQDSSSGKVMRFVLTDETGEIPVVVWNDKVDELEKLLGNRGRVQIVSAKVKKALAEGLELHVDAATYVEVVEPTEEYMKIADLKQGLNHVKVEGEVLAEPTLRDVKTSKGEIVKLAVFELRDETGKIWVSAWREHALSAKSLKTGDKVVMKDAYVKSGFAGQLEMSTRDCSCIIVLDGSD